MEPLTVGLIGFATVLVLITLGMRIAFATGLIGFLGIWAVKDMHVASTLVGIFPYGYVAHYTLSVVPLFILMGYFAFYAGLTEDIFNTARQWLAHLPGGLAIAAVFGCAGFAACTGASVAAAAIMGKVAIPEMEKYGYHPRIASAVVAASGTLAALIPPSVVLVIFGIITDQSVGALLVGGFIPGIVSAIIYGCMIYARVKISPSLGKVQPKVCLKDKIFSLKGTWGIFAIILLVIGGIYSGVFTPTEAGGAGAFGTFVMALAMRKLNLERLRDALLETGETTIMIFFVVIGTIIFTRFLALTGLSTQFMQFVVDLPIPPLLVLISLLSILVFLGMFLDPISMMMLTLPIMFPAVVALGFDPIWFGIITVKMIEIGLITPPIGLNVYIVHNVAPHIPLEEIFRGIFPFVVMDMLTVAFFIAFPQIVTFLPSRMMG